MALPLAALPNDRCPACAGLCLTQKVWRPKSGTFIVSGSLNTQCRHPLCLLAEDVLVGLNSTDYLCIKQGLNSRLLIHFTSQFQLLPLQMA